MTALITKPKDMTEYQWKVYQDLRDGFFSRTMGVGGRWTGSPWEIYGPHIRRACNTLVRNGYFTVDEAGYYYISESLPSSDDSAEVEQ